jgi:hypothetical protein
MSHGLETIASSQTLDGLVSGTSILEVNGIAFSVARQLHGTTLAPTTWDHLGLPRPV